MHSGRGKWKSGKGQWKRGKGTVLWERGDRKIKVQWKGGSDSSADSTVIFVGQSFRGLKKYGSHFTFRETMKFCPMDGSIR